MTVEPAENILKNCFSHSRRGEKEVVEAAFDSDRCDFRAESDAYAVDIGHIEHGIFAGSIRAPLLTHETLCGIHKEHGNLYRHLVVSEAFLSFFYRSDPSCGDVGRMVHFPCTVEGPFASESGVETFAIDGGGSLRNLQVGQHRPDGRHYRHEPLDTSEVPVEKWGVEHDAAAYSRRKSVRRWSDPSV